MLAAAPGRAEREATAFELRQTFCRQLTAARERKGISLRWISDATKVSEGLFADLERGNVSRWPTGIYRRAFFREYAALVGLPGESTVSEFVRLFPEERDRDSAHGMLVPGPLRLTLTRPSWRHLSPLHSQAAALDLAVVLIGSVALTWLTTAGLWTSIAVVALCYHTAGTLILGCSPVTWWARGRGYRRSVKRPARQMNSIAPDE